MHLQAAAWKGEEPFRALTTTTLATSPLHSTNAVIYYNKRLASVPVSLDCVAIGTAAIYRAVLVTRLLQRLPARAVAIV